MELFRQIPIRSNVTVERFFLPHGSDFFLGTIDLALGKMLEIEASQIATIGDMPNDTSMFEKSGLSIAMGQSSEEVKRAATHVTTSSEDEGFANAIDRFILAQV